MLAFDWQAVDWGRTTDLGLQIFFWVIVVSLITLAFMDRDLSEQDRPSSQRGFFCG